MSGMASNLLVGILVTVSALYCVWRLGLYRLRNPIARRLRKLFSWTWRAEDAQASGCEACGGCAFANKRVRVTEHRNRGDL